MHWIVVSEVALDEKNGAGMRAILPYLTGLSVAKLTSLYLRLPPTQPLASVDYLQVPAPNSGRGKALRIFWHTFRKIRAHFTRENHFLILPNTLQDTFMGLACRLLSTNVTIWVMDDFMAEYRSRSWTSRLYNACFGLLYRTARQRVVVAEPMNLHYQKHYGASATVVLGKTLPTTLAPRTCVTILPQVPRKLRLVYLGSFLDFYVEPILELKRLLKYSQNLDLDITLDLYGVHPPPEKWLFENRIFYRGTLDVHRILSTLQDYDFGFLPYSFDSATSQMMSLSFPSKLMDYLGAALPVLCLAPPQLTFVPMIQKRKIGITLTSLSADILEKTLRELPAPQSSLYQEWQAHAHEWAQEFLLDAPHVHQKIRQIFGVD